MQRHAIWFGDRAVLVPVDSPTERESIATWLTHRLPHLLVRRGMACVLVESATPDPALLEVVETNLDTINTTVPPAQQSRDVAIEVDYTGGDLPETAAFFNITEVDLIQAHAAQAWRVAMMGFAPGFGYLEPIGDVLLAWDSLPRRATPRTKVPSGSVAVAAGMSAVYPSASPGGWHLIGSTTARLFDPNDDARPALLQPGARVRFIDLDDGSR
jgi:KipI family sensor histidine kinase inhibitor